MEEKKFEERTFRHCKLEITRQGYDYGLDQLTFSNSMSFFFSKNESFSFSIGSGEEDYINIKNISTEHTRCSLFNDTVILESSENLKVTLGESSHYTLVPGKKKIGRAHV